MNKIAKFFHELVNPHCPDCIADEESKAVCRTCDALRQEISYLRMENRELRDAIIKPKEEPKEPTGTNGIMPIKPRIMPWGVQRQLLEEADRKKAELINQNGKPAEIEKPLTVDEIEKQLGVSNE